ncbi:hypothetical protein BV25DRAFT_1840599, partial [Artomyces pyxidatus]
MMRWYASSGVHPLSQPPQCTGTEVGHLFVHVVGQNEDVQIWMWDETKAWTRISRGHILGHRLWIRPDGAPRWVTRKTATTYDGREKKKGKVAVMYQFVVQDVPDFLRKYRLRKRLYARWLLLLVQFISDIQQVLGQMDCQIGMDLHGDGNIGSQSPQNDRTITTDLLARAWVHAAHGRFAAGKSKHDTLKMRRCSGISRTNPRIELKLSSPSRVGDSFMNLGVHLHLRADDRRLVCVLLPQRPSVGVSTRRTQFTVYRTPFPPRPSFVTDPYLPLLLHPTVRSGLLPETSCHSQLPLFRHQPILYPSLTAVFGITTFCLSTRSFSLPPPRRAGVESALRAKVAVEHEIAKAIDAERPQTDHTARVHDYEPVIEAFISLQSVLKDRGSVLRLMTLLERL